MSKVINPLDVVDTRKVKRDIDIRDYHRLQDEPRGVLTWNDRHNILRRLIHWTAEGLPMYEIIGKQLMLVPLDGKPPMREITEEIEDGARWLALDYFECLNRYEALTKAREQDTLNRTPVRQ